VDLCGHATLAAAHVLYDHLNFEQPGIGFQSRSGILTVTKAGQQFTMDFPADPPMFYPLEPILLDSLGLDQGTILRGKSDLMVVVDHENTVAGIKPDFYKLRKFGVRGIIVTAVGREVDFVSRFFAPRSGINEDPVTGSAHCTMTPYWSKKLGKSVLKATQISPRGGRLRCELAEDRVKLTGSAVTYMTGTISF
jgi:PhzF family phenazine biosynthesis protein